MSRVLRGAVLLVFLTACGGSPGSLQSQESATPEHLTIIGTNKLGSDTFEPVAANVDLATGRYYVLLGCLADDSCQPDEIHRFDADTFKPDGVLRLPGSAADIVGDGHGHLYVSMGDAGLGIIDLPTFRIIDVIKIPFSAGRLVLGAGTLFLKNWEGPSKIASLSTDDFRLKGTFTFPKDTVVDSMSVDPASQNLIVYDDSGVLTELDSNASLVRRRQIVHGDTLLGVGIFSSDDSGRLFGGGNDSVECFELSSLRNCWSVASSGITSLGVFPGRNTLIAVEADEHGRVVAFNTDTGARRTAVELLDPSEMIIDAVRNRILVLQPGANAISLLALT